MNKQTNNGLNNLFCIAVVSLSMYVLIVYACISLQFQIIYISINLLEKARSFFNNTAKLIMRC